MENRTILQRYIDRCEDILRLGDVDEAHLLIGEIVSVFASSIDGLKSGLDSYTPKTFATFGGVTSYPTSPDYVADIRKLKGKLEVEIEKILRDKAQDEDAKGVIANMEDKPYKIFISHSSKDKSYVLKLVELFEDIGVQEKCMFCSSVDGYGIPLGENIYNYLCSQFDTYRLHVIFVLSENYYQSAACLNEMGASWVLRQSYTTILLPGFTYRQIDGAIDPREIALKLDTSDDELNNRLNELMAQLCEKFSIERPSLTKWERIRKRFKEAIVEVANAAEYDNSNGIFKEGYTSDVSSQLSHDAIIFLAYAGADNCGEIVISQTIIGTSICVGKYNFVSDGDAKDEARWMRAIDELQNHGLISVYGATGESFKLTHKGFQMLDYVGKDIDTSRSLNEYLV